MLTTFDRESFAKVQGSMFTVPAGENTVQIELAKVTESRETAFAEAFSLIFLAPSGIKIEQGLYDLEHETLGAMLLFLVPVGIEDGRLQLEAVFNLLKEKPKVA